MYLFKRMTMCEGQSSEKVINLFNLTLPYTISLFSKRENGFEYR